MDYLDAVRAAILAQVNFQFVAGSGKIRDVQLKADGSILDPDNEVSRWSLIYDAGRSLCVLTLVNDSNIPYSILTMQREGSWKGRDRRTMGTVLLRPLPLLASEKWRNLADPVTFFRLTKPQERKPEFHYLEPLPRQKDWEKEDAWEIVQEIDVSLLPVKTEKSEAIALIGWNRLDYWEQVVQSIAQNPQSQTLPVFVFLDKYHDTTVTDKLADMAKRAFPYTVVIRRDRTFGCGRNIIDARRQLFDVLKYDYAWVFEDDLVVAPNYMAFCQNLMRWAEENYSFVGAVQGWTKTTEDLAWKQSRLNTVRATYNNWWGYLMKREAWESMRELMYSYRALFLGGDYGARPHRTVVDWFRNVQREKVVKPVGAKPRFVETASSVRDRQMYFASPPSGQDAATMTSFYQNGWIRLTPTVNRARYIGVHGIHMTPAYWERMNFGKVSLDVFAEDSTRMDFIPEH